MRMMGLPGYCSSYEKLNHTFIRGKWQLDLGQWTGSGTGNGTGRLKVQFHSLTGTSGWAGGRGADTPYRSHFRSNMAEKTPLKKRATKQTRRQIKL